MLTGAMEKKIETLHKTVQKYHKLQPMTPYTELNQHFEIFLSVFFRT